MLIKNKQTGAVWDVDPKSPAYRRIKGLPEEYEEVEPPKTDEVKEFPKKKKAVSE